jgi:hypothetical protein
MSASFIESPVAMYRTALDRLREASRLLADHLESADQSETDVAGSKTFVEIWAHYKRTLTECHKAFQQVPLRLRDKVPPPPQA